MPNQPIKTLMDMIAVRYVVFIGSLQGWGLTQESGYGSYVCNLWSLSTVHEKSSCSTMLSPQVEDVPDHRWSYRNWTFDRVRSAKHGGASSLPVQKRSSTILDIARPMWPIHSEWWIHWKWSVTGRTEWSQCSIRLDFPCYIRVYRTTFLVQEQP